MLSLFFEVALKQRNRGIVCSRISEVVLAGADNEGEIINILFNFLSNNNKYISYSGMRALVSLLLLLQGPISELVLHRLVDIIVHSSNWLQVGHSCEAIKRVIEWKDNEEHPLDTESLGPPADCQSNKLSPSDVCGSNEVKYIATKILDCNWLSLIARSSKFLEIHSLENEHVIVSFLSLWTALISVKNNLNVEDTKEFYSGIETLVKPLLVNGTPLVVWEKILDLFNEVLCYGSTLALQEVLAEEPCNLAHSLIRAVNTKHLFEFVPCEQPAEDRTQTRTGQANRNQNNLHQQPSNSFPGPFTLSFTRTVKHDISNQQKLQEKTQFHEKVNQSASPGNTIFSVPVQEQGYKDINFSSKSCQISNALTNLLAKPDDSIESDDESWSVLDNNSSRGEHMVDNRSRFTDRPNCSSDSVDSNPSRFTARPNCSSDSVDSGVTEIDSQCKSQNSSLTSILSPKQEIPKQEILSEHTSSRHVSCNNDILSSEIPPTPPHDSIGASQASMQQGYQKHNTHSARIPTNNLTEIKTLDISGNIIGESLTRIEPFVSFDIRTTISKSSEYSSHRNSDGVDITPLNLEKSIDGLQILQSCYSDDDPSDSDGYIEASADSNGKHAFVDNRVQTKCLNGGFDDLNLSNSNSLDEISLNKSCTNWSVSDGTPYSTNQLVKNNGHINTDRKCFAMTAANGLLHSVPLKLDGSENGSSNNCVANYTAQELTDMGFSISDRAILPSECGGPTGVHQNSCDELFPDDDDILCGESEGLHTDRHLCLVLVRKMVLLVLKAIAVTVKEARGDSSSSASERSSPRSGATGSETEESDMEIIGRRLAPNMLCTSY